MRKTQVSITLFALTAVLLLAGSSTRAEGAAATAGKSGTISVSASTQVGDLTLAPGRYRVQHIARDSAQYIRFTPEKAPRESLGEVLCTLGPSGRKARTMAATYTTVDGVRTLLALKLRGETAAHLF